MGIELTRIVKDPFNIIITEKRQTLPETGTWAYQIGEEPAFTVDYKTKNKNIKSIILTYYLILVISIRVFSYSTLCKKLVCLDLA